METSYDKRNKSTPQSRMNADSYQQNGPPHEQFRDTVNREFERDSQWNDLISTLSHITEATEDIDHLLHSLHTLARLSADASRNGENDTPERKEQFEEEAQRLLDSIDEKSSLATREGLRPLMGDPVEFCLDAANEERIRLSLPETSRDQLGLKRLNICPNEGEELPFRTIENAHARIQTLRSQLEETRSYAREAMLRLEISSENHRASGSDIRDLEAAIELAGELQYTIEAKRGKALSASLLDLSCLSLLNEDEQ